MFKARMKPPNGAITRMVQGTLFMDAFLHRGWVIVDDPMNRLPHGYANEVTADAEVPEVTIQAQGESVPQKSKRGRPRGSKNVR